MLACEMHDFHPQHCIRNLGISLRSVDFKGRGTQNSYVEGSDRFAGVDYSDTTDALPSTHLTAEADVIHLQLILRCLLFSFKHTVLF